MKSAHNAFKEIKAAIATKIQRMQKHRKENTDAIAQEDKNVQKKVCEHKDLKSLHIKRKKYSVSYTLI